MIKIAIIGTGNAGCITALHFYKYLSEESHSFEIEMYHSPIKHPIEKVGQGTTLNVLQLYWQVLKSGWYDNKIGATIKTGILYENWGKKQDKIFHDFPLGNASIHMIPSKLSKTVIESNLFTVTEKEINNPEKEIDANVIFDCRGRHNRDKNNYDSLINPLNSVLLSTKHERDPDLTYTRCVATPNGWTFVIPNENSVSYGYLYNNKITTRNDAMEDFCEKFNVSKIYDELVFENYMAKNFTVGERTILQGNAYGFIEPMEATSIGFYQYICRQSWDFIFKIRNYNYCNNQIRKNMIQLQNIILWHYQYGSKYDTPFWQYAKSLPFNPDDEFYDIINSNDQSKYYGQWQAWNFDNWKKGVEI